MHWSSTSSEFQQWLEPASSMPQSTVFMCIQLTWGNWTTTCLPTNLNEGNKFKFPTDHLFFTAYSPHKVKSSAGQQHLELSHECPTVNYPRSWQHTKNVADPSAVNENNNQCNLHLLQWIIKFRKNDLSYTIYISCTMVQNDSTLACTI